MESIIQSAISAFSNFFAPKVIIFLISLMPILELRGGMLAASLLRVDWKEAMGICIIGNILPIPFILLFINKIFQIMKNTRFVKLVNKFENKAREKSKDVFKYRNLGLFLFVAVPIPGTGAWMGSLVAALFGIPIKQALLSIFAGILSAAVIMAVLSYGVLGIFI